MIDKIINNYKVLSEIGEGAMGTVYLAEHIHIKRKAAIKSLHKKLFTNDTIKMRFRNEARALSHIEHPNIVKLYDYVENEDGYFLIMEYLDGVALDEYIKKESGPVREEDLIKIFSGILSAFSFAHSKGIIHRDAKPSNIMISRDFSIVKVLDFGIAKIKNADSNITKDGTQMGTAYYMSPEQVRGESVDNRSDVYSLGITLYQTATGLNPYIKLNTEYDIYNSIINVELVDAKSIYPYVTDKINAILKKATQKDVSKRYQSCDEMLADLTAEKVPIIANKPVGNNKKGVKKRAYFWAASIISIILIITSWFLFSDKIHDYLKWKNAEIKYSIADSLKFRSTTTLLDEHTHKPISYNILEEIEFGHVVRILKRPHWDCLVEAKINDEIGYVDTGYLISKAELDLLNFLLPTAEHKQKLALPRYRKSLIKFIKENDFSGYDCKVVRHHFKEGESYIQLYNNGYYSCCIIPLKSQYHPLEVFFFCSIYMGEEELYFEKVQKGGLNLFLKKISDRYYLKT